MKALFPIMLLVWSGLLISLTQEQLTSTGGVWQACDQFAQLPKGQFVTIKMQIMALLNRNLVNEH